jgi:hypothetical protein
MFLLHVHGLNSTNHPNSALEFVAETPSGRDNDRIQLQHLTSLGDLRWVLENGSDEVEYKQVRTVARKASDSEVHIATDQSPWYKVDDLQSALGSEDFRKRLTPILRIQLASMIAITHLYFADIRVTSTEVSPVNIVYYNDSISWEDLEPFVLNPFLSIGFGSRKSRVKLGFSSGRLVQKNKTKQNKKQHCCRARCTSSQIRSCARIDDGKGPEGFRKAKEHALESVHAVDQTMGASYAEAIQLCLEWRPTSLILILEMMTGGRSRVLLGGLWISKPD